MSKLVYENDIKDENWLTLPGEVKVTEKADATWNSASNFVFFKEDHTVANLLRMKLHTNRQVRFCGYKHPHPTIHNIEMTVQTAPVHTTAGAGQAAVAAIANSNNNGNINPDAAFTFGMNVNTPVPTPAEAVLLALSECIADVDQFAALWEKEVAPKVDANGRQIM